MQLKALHIAALTLVCAVLLALALPAPHAAAQSAGEPAILTQREAGQEECGFAFTFLQSLLQDKLTMSLWLGDAYEDRKCLQEVADTAFARYEDSVNDARAVGPAAVQTAFERRALDLVSANARLREFMLKIARLVESSEFLDDIEARIAWIEEIEAGDPHELYETALDVRDGNGLPQHRDAAVTWLERAGDHGVPEALYAAARMELVDLGDDLESVAGENLLKRAARKNVVEAQKELGLRLVAKGAHWGYLHFSAYAWLLMAEANGAVVDDDALAEPSARLSEERRQEARTKVQRSFGGDIPYLWLLRDDPGQANNWKDQLEIALRWDECSRALSVLEGARRGGEAVAEYKSAELYNDGICVTQNFDRAFEHYLLAARGGYGLSKFPLSLMYYDGRGTPRDLAQARHWFKASALTLVRSFYCPGERLRDARGYMPERYYDNLPPELVAEIEWLAEIEDGDPRTLFETAVRVRDGDGLPQDRSAAVNWFFRAGDRGLPEAYYVVGIDLLDDPPRSEYIKTGIKALAQAGRDEFVLAQVELGRRYAAGNQVRQWDHAAYVWLLMAAENGADVGALLEEVGGRMSDQEREAAREEAETGTYYPLDSR